MAISVLQSPDLYSSGFNPMMYVVSSNQTAQDNFRFYTKIKDGSGNVIAEFRNLPHPGENSFFFSPHRTIQTYLSYDIANLINQTTGWQGGTNVFKKYTLEIQEEYGTPVSGHASGSTSAKYAVNSALDYQTFTSLNLSDRIAGGTSRKFLNNAPNLLPIRLSDSYEVGTISTSNNSVYTLKIETYNSDSELLKTATVDNPNPTLTNDTDRFLSILVGPADLNATTLTTGTQDLIEANTDWYRVAVFNSSNVQQTAWQSFKIDMDCTRSGSYDRLVWLNKYGRFDAFNFTSVGEDIIEVDKSNYERPLGTFNGSIFQFLSYQRQRSQFYTKQKQSYKLRSGYFDTATAQWLKELMSSPLVYMVSGGDFIAVTVLETNYTAKNTLTTKLIDLELTVTLSVDTQRQAL